MNKYYFLFTFLLIAISGFFGYKMTYALFSDDASSQNNTFTAAQSFPTQAGDVVINEIMWMGSQGNSADEWIELRNMTGDGIDLSNWVIDNLGSGASNNIIIPAGKSIGANGFFLISNDLKETSIINVDPDYQTASVSLQNNGEQLILKNNLATTIDTANIADDWFAGENPSGQNPKKSMERNLIPGDGTLDSNWHTASTSVNLDLSAPEKATPRAPNS